MKKTALILLFYATQQNEKERCEWWVDWRQRGRCKEQQCRQPQTTPL